MKEKKIPKKQYYYYMVNQHGLIYTEILFQFYLKKVQKLKYKLIYI